MTLQPRAKAKALARERASNPRLRVGRGLSVRGADSPSVMGSRGAANAPFAALEAAGFQGGRHAPWSMGMQGESEYLALARWGSGERGSLPGRYPSATSLVRVSGHESPDLPARLWRFGRQAGDATARRCSGAQGSMPQPRQPQGVSNRGRHAPFGKMARTQDGLGSGRSTEHILRFTALPPSSARL